MQTHPAPQQPARATPSASPPMPGCGNRTPTPASQAHRPSGTTSRAPAPAPGRNPRPHPRPCAVPSAHSLCGLCVSAPVREEVFKVRIPQPWPRSVLGRGHRDRSGVGRDATGMGVGMETLGTGMRTESPEDSVTRGDRGEVWARAETGECGETRDPHAPGARGPERGPELRAGGRRGAGRGAALPPAPPPPLPPAPPLLLAAPSSPAPPRRAALPPSRRRPARRADIWRRRRAARGRVAGARSMEYNFPQTRKIKFRADQI